MAFSFPGLPPYVERVPHTMDVGLLIAQNHARAVASLLGQVGDMPPESCIEAIARARHHVAALASLQAACEMAIGEAEAALIPEPAPEPRPSKRGRHAD